MQNLLSLNFWFKLRPGLMLPASQKIFFGLLIALAIAAAVSFFIKKREKGRLYGRLWNGLNSFSLTNLAIGLILLFFNYELVPFLSARFWFLIWAAEMAVWAVFIIKRFADIPKIKKQMEEEKEFKKYIP